MPDTKYAFFTFSLPEDQDSNYLRLFSSTSETGTYSQVGADIAYDYGDTQYEYTNITETLWYKIQFYNSVTAKLGPLSNAVYGGNFSANAPEMFVSTSTDGANYATIQDVLDYATISTADFSSTLISKCLKRARAIIDLRTAEMGIDRFLDYFDSEIARKKYNAALKIVKEVEILFTLAMVYRAKSDDKILEQALSGEGELEALRIGSTAISTDSSGSGPKNYWLLIDLANKYATSGASLLAMLAPTSIFLSFYDIDIRRIWYPFGWKNVY